MKTTRLFSLIGTALIGLSVPAWAGPHSVGGGFAGGGHFAGSHFGGSSGGIRAAPTFSGGGVRFSGNQSIGGLSRAPIQQFSYYRGARTAAVLPQASARQLPERSISPNIGRAAPVNRQPNRVGSAIGQKRVSDPPLSTAANRQSFMKDHAFCPTRCQLASRLGQATRPLSSWSRLRLHRRLLVGALPMGLLPFRRL